MANFCDSKDKQSLMNNLIADMEIVLGTSITDETTLNNLKSMLNKTMVNAGIFDNKHLKDLSDSIAYTIWTKHDIRGELIELGYEATDENIDAVIDSGLLHLTDDYEREWEIIHNAIEKTLGKEEERDER